MKKLQLIHNPGAGDKKLDKKLLLRFLKEQGLNCRYFSTEEKGWKNFISDTPVIIAGGDGTVRKAAAQILKRKLLDKPEYLSILPLGTANNIAKSLKLKGDLKKIISSRKQLKTFDVARVFTISGEKFFLEGFGYGVFPDLIKKMQNFDNAKATSAQKSINTALKLLHQIILSSKPMNCKLKIDGKNYSGKFISIEVMNIPSIGPNLYLSPDSDPGDGEFEVALISVKHRKKFASYVAAKLKGKEELLKIQILKGKNISISCDCKNAHIDDQLVKISEGRKIFISLKKGLLNFETLMFDSTDPLQ